MTYSGQVCASALKNFVPKDNTNICWKYVGIQIKIVKILLKEDKVL